MVSGMDREAKAALVRRLLAARQGLAVVTHCLDQIDVGLVSRSIQRSSMDVRADLIELAHGCVSCTLREDVLPVIVEVASLSDVTGVVLVLPEAVEPLGFLEAFASVPLEGSTTTASDHLTIDALVQVIDPAGLTERLESEVTLRDVGLAVDGEDDRRVAEVLVAGIEVADVIVAPDVTETARAVLRVLNAEAEVVGGLGWDARFDWERTTARSDCAFPLPVGGEAESEEVWAFTWICDRPFHPVRLHDCLGDFGESMRGRGTIHLASRPETAVAWDSVGSRIALGLVADVEGVHCTAVSFMGVNGRSDLIRSRLIAATLDDDEMAAGPDQWASLPDPFTDLWNETESEDV